MGRDLVVTFLGVALALGAAGAWSVRQEHQAQHAALVQLLDATRENEGRIIAAVHEDSAVVTFADRLQVARVPSEITHALRAAGHPPVWHPVLAPYASLLATPRGTSASDTRVHAQVRTYAGDLESVAGTLARMEPAALQNATEAERLLEGAATDSTHVAERLRDDPATQNVLRTGRVLAHTRLEHLLPLREESAQLRHVLAVELGLTEPEPAR